MSIGVPVCSRHISMVRGPEVMNCANISLVTLHLFPQDFHSKQAMLNITIIGAV